MPAFVAGFTAFFTGATVVGVAGTLGYLSAVAVFNAALGAIARKLTSKKGGEDTGLTQPREVTVRATDAYDVFVYGRALVGGVTVYHNAIPDADGINSRMHHVVKWAGHECTSISLFRLDDRDLNPANCDWTPRSYDFAGEAGLVTTGEFRGSSANSGPTYMRWYMGDQRSADLRLAGQSSEWTAQHIGRDQTYGILEIHQVDGGDQTSKVYQKGFPQTIAPLIHGKKIYDHRRYALNRDPLFTETSSWWGSGVGSAGHFTALTSWQVVDGIGGPNDHGVQVLANTVFQSNIFSEPVPCHPDSLYALFMTMRRQGERPVLRAGVSFWTDDGTNITDGGNTYFYTLANTQVPATWTELTTQLGSGGVFAVPASARLMRAFCLGIGSHASFTANTTALQIQDMGVRDGWGSRHLVNVSSTWEYSESPPFCVADYLKDERLGYGKRLRVPVNASRYARNGDPTWRRLNTLTNGVWWRTLPDSGQTTALGSTASISLTQTGAPVGRRALVVAGSAGTGVFGHAFFSDAIPIDPSGQYFVSVQARQDGPKRAQLGLAFLDGNGENIHGTNSSDATGWIFGTYHNFMIGPLSSTWSSYVIAIGSGSTASIPSCASFVALHAACVRSFGTNGDTQQYFQDYRLMVGTQDRHFIEPHEQIYWPSVSSAAAYTDAIVSTPSGDQVRFACNGAGHTGTGHRENVRNLLSSFNGRAVYVQSGFHITAGWEEPTKTLNKSDFRAGGMKIRAKAEMPDRYNHVRGTFYDRESEYKRVPAATVTADEYIARDSSQQLFHDTHLPFTNDWYMAQRVEFGILEQGDNQQLVEFQLKHSALDLMPGRVVGINHDVVSWTNHTLRMVDMETDLKKGIKLFGREDYAASYVDPSTGEYYSRNFTGVTSAAPIVPQVSSVNVTPRDGGVQLNWNNPAARSFEWIDVYRRTTNAFSGSTLVKSTRNDEYFDTLQAGQTQYYWFRSRDFAGNVSSIYPGLTSSFSGAGLFPVARDPEYVFFEEFRYQSLAEFRQKWDQGGSDVDNFAFVGSGTVGGNLIQSSGANQFVSKTRIPYDPEALYQMTVKVRQTTSVDASRLFYAGFVGYRADAVTPINASSQQTAFTGQHFFVRNAENLGSLGLWVEYTGHVRGHMPWPLSGTVNANLSQDPKLAARMHNLVRYVSPLVFLNQPADTATAEVDYVSVRKLIPLRDLTLDPNITIQSNWIYARSDGGDDVSAVGVNSANQWAVQSLVNVNIAGEYNVLPLATTAPLSSNVFIIAERFRPDFHPKMPSSGAYMASIRVRVNSFNHAGVVSFVPALIAYTRAGSAVATFQDLSNVAANVRPGSSSGPPILASNLWHDAGGTITVGSHNDINPNSGPYFLAPSVRVDNGTVQAVLSSAWIAYLNITPGNP